MSEMKKICYDLFILSGLIDHFKINIKALTHLIEAVASHYRLIPYHNFNHIVHVLHSTWMMLQVTIGEREGYSDRLISCSLPSRRPRLPKPC